MTQRERFFKRLRGERIDHTPFFPDISVWYKYQRTAGRRSEYSFLPGQLIPDSSAIHDLKGSMPVEFRGMTYLQLCEHLDFGLPVHIYRWYETRYEGTVYREERGDDTIGEIYETPIGEIKRVKRRSSGSDSFVITEYPVKSIDDLKILRYILNSRIVEPDFQTVNEITETIGEQGVADLVITRSPFGKLVHEWLGLVNLNYALSDSEHEICSFLAFLESFDMEIVSLAAGSPIDLVILGDNMDEHLISPPQFKRYCIPFYQRMNRILHQAGRKTSIHMDGNIKNLLPFLHEMDFDLLDGLTPSPVNNYEVEDLAAALKKNMKTYCGIPSSLFVTNVPDSEILSFAERILETLRDQLILNVGDIVPPNANINQVVSVNQLFSR